MGIKESALALADELEAFEDGDCEECGLYGQPECKGHLSCMEIMARYAARKMREAVERDGEGATTVSAYDLLSDEDREALAWVREMGGVEAAKASIHQGAMEHGCLLKVAEMLGTSIYDGTSNADALLDKLEKRLMPEGMEWPKVDGKPVDFKTAYVPSLGVLEAVSIYNTGACQVMSHDGIIKSAKDIHIVKPKVLDADGVPCCIGDEVWDIHIGEHQVIEDITGTCGWYETLVVRLDSGEQTTCDAVRVSHRRPVLDADGVPIKKGDTVYVAPVAPFDDPMTVRGFAADGRVLMDYHSDDSFGYRPEYLTHAKPEPPDSWERVEEDAKLAPGDYIEKHGRKTDLYAYEEMPIDLVRRCRALAEKENKNE